MSKLRESVSFSAVSATSGGLPARRGYELPLTNFGVHLEDVAHGGVPEFLLHEFGHIDRLMEWDARDVLSPFWRLYYNFEPGAIIEHKGQKIALLPETFWFVPENVRFTGQIRRPVPHLWLHFTMRPAYAFTQDAPFGVPADDLLLALAADLRSVSLPPMTLDAMRGLFFRGMALLNATFSRAKFPPARPVPSTLRDALRRIENSPHDDLSNARLARICGLSTGGFTRLFSAHVGMPPAVYVRRARVNYASRLLAFTSASIEQVAEAAGFPNRHHFSRVFQRHIGCGPAAFRKLHQSGKIAGTEAQQSAGFPLSGSPNGPVVVARQ